MEKLSNLLLRTFSWKVAVRIQTKSGYTDVNELVTVPRCVILGKSS